MQRVANVGTPGKLSMIGVKRTAIAAAVLLAAAAARAQDAPCAACVAVSIAASQRSALPERLDGVTVFVTADTPAAGEVVSTIDDVRRRGGTAGAVVEWNDPSPVVANASVVVLRVPDDGAAGRDADLAFALKNRITAIRGSMPPGSRIGIRAAGALVDRLAAHDIASYVDLFLIPDERTTITSRPVWRELGTIASAEDAMRRVPASVDRVLIAAPEEAAVARALLADLTRMAASVDVTAARPLSVEEIVARHQAAAARQRRLVRTLVTTGRMTLTFEVPGMPAPVTIVSDAVIYADGSRTEIEQRRILVNGLEYRNSGIPRLPLIEPERVAEPPLSISLSDRYAYRLAGRERVRGIPCFVVAFEPVDRQPAFRGRAWIAEADFGLVRTAAAQTGLSGPIVSSEQVDEFRPESLADADGPTTVWLLARSDVRQIYEGAAHRTPLHRIVEVDGQVVNGADFEARRLAAYASGSLMMRDTAAGYRYLERVPRERAAADVPIVPALARGTRRMRTVAAGVILDPNISHPLPFAGLGYVDFDLLGTGAQLNAFVGGTYGQLAWSAPSIGGSRWHLAGRAFGIASSFHDRAFADGREQYAENIRQRPAHVSASLLRALTARLTARLAYELDYTAYDTAESTAHDFRLPSDQIAHGLRVALEGQRAGWTASAWWNPVRRSGWRDWGYSGAGTATRRHRDFQRFGASVARSTVLTEGVLVRTEAAWMTGQDLDRFSRYTFGTFDNRLRGYPSALIRYDRGAVVRNAVAWSATRVVRIDGFLDAAWAHDPSIGRGLRNYTGIGAALEAPAPLGCLAAVEWGYGLQGVRSNGRRGTHVVRVSAVKVF